MLGTGLHAPLATRPFSPTASCPLHHTRMHRCTPVPQQVATNNLHSQLEKLRLWEGKGLTQEPSELIIILVLINT